MAEAVVAIRTTAVRSSQTALHAVAKLWFVVAVIGQWMFTYFILAFYYRPTIQGHFEAWSRNENLIKGYVAGDRTGNLYFAAHVLLAALITTSGALQLVPQVRTRAPKFHRWNGRFYLPAAVLMASSGLWLVWVRRTYLSLYGGASNTLLAVLIIVSAAMTLREALRHRIELHRRWALRLFVVVNGVWFQRIGYMAWVILKRPLGIGKNMDDQFDIVWGFAEFLLPLAILELYLRATSQKRNNLKFIVAAVILILTVIMGVGIFGAYTTFWRPLITMASA